MKLTDLLNNLLYDGKTPDLKSEGENKAFEDFNKKAKPLIDKIKEIGNAIDLTAEKLAKAKKEFGGNSPEAAKYKNRAEKLEEEWHKTNQKITKIIEEIGKSYNLSADQLDHVNEAIITSANKTKRSGLDLKQGLNNLDTHVNNGFSGILSSFGKNIGKIANIFGAAGPLVDAAAYVFGKALIQMEELNRKLVEFNREMSQGFSNNLLGMDLYGNGANGSLRTIAGENNISEDSILDSLKTFKKGKILGLNENLEGHSDQMTKFAVEAAQLTKFYGIQAGTINSISKNLVYNYGVKIKDLSSVFEHGKEVAMQAGVSVSQYFENLKAATDLVGEKYVAGGIKGLERLAEYATRTDQTISEIMKSTNKYQKFESQYQNQNQASALGLQNTAGNTGQIWALKKLGRDQEANALLNGGLTKDILSNGDYDENNNITNPGMDKLTAMGVDKDQIATIQKLIKLNKEQGISMEQLQDPLKQDLATRRKIVEFEKENMTIGEKYTQMWAKTMGQIIDPLANALAPILDVVIDLLGGLTDALSSIIIFIKDIIGLGKKEHKDGQTEGSDAGGWGFISNTLKFVSNTDSKKQASLFADMMDNLGFFDKATDAELEESKGKPTVTNTDNNNGLLNKVTTPNPTTTAEPTVKDISFVSTHEKQMRMQSADFWKDMNIIWTKGSMNMWGDIGSNTKTIADMQIKTAKSLSDHIKSFFNSDKDEQKAEDARKKFAENKAAGLVYSVQNIMNNRESTVTGVAEKAQAERLEKLVTQPVHIEIKQAFDGSIRSRVTNK